MLKNTEIKNRLVMIEIMKDWMKILGILTLFVLAFGLGAYLANAGRDKSKDIKYYHAIVIWDHYIVLDTVTTDTSYTKQQFNSLFGGEDVRFIYRKLN